MKEKRRKKQAKKLKSFWRGISIEMPPYYQQNEVYVRTIEHTEDGQYRIEYSVKVTQFDYCPGVDLARRGELIAVSFVRSPICGGVRKPAVAAVASVGTCGELIHSVVFPALTGRLLLLTDSSGTSTKLLKTKEAGTEVQKQEEEDKFPGVEIDANCGQWLLAICSSEKQFTQWSDLAFGLIGNGYFMYQGHAWLELYNCQTGDRVAIYALWPDDHPFIVDGGLANGPGSDVRTDFYPDTLYAVELKYMYAKCLTDAQKTAFDNFIGQNHTYRITNNCSSFASDAFYAATGEDIDADDWAGFETPRELGASIYDANGGVTSNSATPGTGGTSGN